MQEYEIERFGSEPLKFRGRKVISIESAPLTETEQKRRFELSLYRLADDVFVAQTTFLSDVRGEVNVAAAELLDDATTVENFFFAFEPDEFLKRSEVKLPAGELQQLAGKLYSSYETAVRQIMECLSEWKESKTDAFKPAEEIHSDH